MKLIASSIPVSFKYHSPLKRGIREVFLYSARREHPPSIPFKGEGIFHQGREIA